MSDDVVAIVDAIRIPLDRLHPNKWNPNEQTASTFNQLTEEIKADGFEQPLNVVPCSCDVIEGDHYLIIGGEHRWKVATVLEMTELPCYVHEDWDEATQKLKTVRRNLMTGQLNDAKFTRLVADVTERFEIPQEELARLMGFDDEADFLRHVVKEKDKKERSFLESLADESRREGYALDSLTDIISNIFTEAGDTLDQNFLFFTYKGKMQCVVLCDAPLMKVVEQMITHVRASGEMITDVIREALELRLRSDSD